MLACDSAYFAPGDKNAAARDLKLPENKKIIFFGAQNMSDPRKGFKALMEALEHLKKMLPAAIAEKILLVYASKEDIETVSFPFQHIRLPFLQGEEQLAKAYQVATVFVSPSLEDAGPMMIAEAMLCGTPVVAYDIGLARDAIVNGLTGFTIPKGEIVKFASCIRGILEMDPDNYDNMSKACSKNASVMFSVKREVEEYGALFRERLKIKQDA